jgi:SAM-dependent methyltransferase
LVDEVVSHYSRGDLLGLVVAAIGEAGIDPVTVADLAPADEFHVGGRTATEHLVSQAGFAPGARLLDVGSGLWGTARYLAETGAHPVTGVDITAELVAVAHHLSHLVGLADLTTFVRCSALDLPFAADVFDGAVQLHVGMNIADKQRLFAGVARVLRPGSMFAVYDLMGRPGAPIEFPLPWASSPSTSHLAPAETYVAELEAAGFSVESVVDRSGFALVFFEQLRSRTPGPVGLELVMGEEASVKYRHMVGAVEAGHVAPVVVMARVVGARSH